MNKVTVGLDWIRYPQKPKNNYEFPKIKQRAASNWTEVDLEDFAVAVGNFGQAFLPGNLVGGMKANCCVGMQVFGLDFDDGTPYEEIRNRCLRWGIPFTFSYETLSSTPENVRFRIVFVHDTLIEDMYVVDLILNILHKLFPECDHACRNKDRLFMGGKNLLEFNAGARMALVNLLPPLYEVLSSNNNFQRNLQSFCNLNRVLLVDGQAAMGDAIYLPTLLENDEIRANSILHIINEVCFSSFFVLEAISDVKNTQDTKVRRDIHSSPMKKLRINLDRASNYPCELLNRFLAGMELNHNERFALYTNLLHIKGGVKLFMEVLEEYYPPGTVEKWAGDYKYMKNYQPMLCSDSFCPYYEDGSCISMGNIVKTLNCSRRVIRTEKNLCSIDEAAKACGTSLWNAIKSNDDSIHLIKGQTAIGKTTLYTDIIDEMKNKKFIVALPTNLLKMKVYKILTDKDDISEEDVYYTRSLRDPKSKVDKKIREEYESLENKGMYREAKQLLVEYLEKVKKYERESQELIKDLESLINNSEEMSNARVIVTTHAKFLHLPESILSDRICIVDEDILLQHILKKTHSLSLAAVEQLAAKKIPGYSGIAEKILHSQKGRYEKIVPDGHCTPLSEEKIKENDLFFYDDDNINDIVRAAAFVISKSEEGVDVVKYFCPEYLPKCKLIILSATLNEIIYRAYFSNRTVIMHPVMDAKYTGRVIQYTYHSLGRSEMARNKDKVFELAIKKLQKANEVIIIQENKNDFSIRLQRTKRNVYKNSNQKDTRPTIITFKMYEKIEGCREHGLHFGNAAGINDLEGSNLAVVGTPYDVDYAYKLIAYYLGADVNTKVDERPRWRRVTYKGDNFMMVTYNDEKLREVQLYAISSELEQCIGRSRVLRKDCTVYVFSCFPCEQAEIRTVNYLLPEIMENWEEEVDKCLPLAG